MAKRKKQKPVGEVPFVARRLMSERSAEYLCLSLILIAASFLLLWNLGNQYLWQDEAQTACISRTVLQYGVPHGYDGTNYFSQEAGAEYGPNHVWRWHTWLPFYVLAGVFAILGESTFTARLPFALFGVGTIVMAYYLGKSLWRSRRAGVISAALLLLSVPFLLLVKQCRLYSPAAFFSLWGLYAYLGMTEGRRRSGLAYAAASLLLFHTHYLYYGTLAATVVIHAAIFHRERLKSVLLVSGIVFLLNLPWIIWMSGADFDASISYQTKAAMKGGNKLAQFRLLASYYIRMVFAHIFPPMLLVVPATAVAASWVRRRRFPMPNRVVAGPLSLVLIFIVVSILACAQLSPYPHFRYLATVIPAFWILTAYMMECAMSSALWSLGLVFMALLAYAGPTRSYLYEITHDYDGPVEGVVKYLTQHAKPSDVIACFHEEMPLKFYLPNKVYGGLTGEDISGARWPKWIVLRTPDGKEEWKVVEALKPELGSREYEFIYLDGYPDIPFENRESPNEHFFETVREAKPVRILEKAD